MLLPCPSIKSRGKKVTRYWDIPYMTYFFLFQGHEMAVSPDTEYFPADWLGVEVSGATLGIVGMGTIGYKVAERAKAFEMKILYHNRNQR